MLITHICKQLFRQTRSEMRNFQALSPVTQNSMRSTSVLLCQISGALSAHFTDFWSSPKDTFPACSLQSLKQIHRLRATALGTPALGWELRQERKQSSGEMDTGGVTTERFAALREYEEKKCAEHSTRAFQHSL